MVSGLVAWLIVFLLACLLVNYVLPMVLPSLALGVNLLTIGGLVFAIIFYFLWTRKGKYLKV